MANPRPCVCGHPESEHTTLVPEAWNPCRLCWRGWPGGDWCPLYRGVSRTEPLRARRNAQLGDTGVRLPGDGRHYNVGAIVPPLINERPVRP